MKPPPAIRKRHPMAVQCKILKIRVMNLYSMKKKIISLVLFCLIGLLAYGQGGLIEGTVISSSGDSLENARITLRENPIVEVYTDAGGAFSLSAQAGQHLVIEYKNRYNKVVSVDQLMEDGLIHGNHF